MNKIVLGILLIVLTIPLIIAEGDSLRVVLTNPKAVFSLEEGERLDHYLGVKNKNDFPIDVSIDYKGDVPISFNEESVSMEPGEAHEFQYRTDRLDSGNYSIKINVVFSRSDISSYSLQQNVILEVKEKQRMDIGEISEILLMASISLFFIFITIKIIRSSRREKKDNTDRYYYQEMKGGVEE